MFYLKEKADENKFGPSSCTGFVTGKKYKYKKKYISSLIYISCI